MIVTRLELANFRNYVEASFEFHHGITAVVGLNGQGKTYVAPIEVPDDDQVTVAALRKRLALMRQSRDQYAELARVTGEELSRLNARCCANCALWKPFDGAPDAEAGECNADPFTGGVGQANYRITPPEHACSAHHAKNAPA